MEVGLYDDNEYRALDKAATVSLQVADVTLEAPTSIRSDETATFIVGFPADDPRLRYRVNFDDGSDPSAWDISPTATHTYTAGTYRPFGEIGRASDAGMTPLTASARAELVVVQVGTIPGGGDGGNIEWLPYVALALVTLLLGYGARQLFVVPKPTFTLHHGQTDSQIDTAQGVTVQLEVRLHRNIDGVQSTLITGSGRLITDSRRRL